MTQLLTLFLRESPDTKGNGFQPLRPIQLRTAKSSCSVFFFHKQEREVLNCHSRVKEHPQCRRKTSPLKLQEACKHVIYLMFVSITLKTTSNCKQPMKPSGGANQSVQLEHINVSWKNKVALIGKGSDGFWRNRCCNAEHAHTHKHTHMSYYRVQSLLRADFSLQSELLQILQISFAVEWVR